MSEPIVPAADPADTASVRAALEALQTHLRKVAGRYRTAAGNMEPKLAGSLTLAGVPEAEYRAELFASSLRSLAGRLDDVAGDWAQYALDALESIKEWHDQHATEGEKNG